jgi:hypothetical protein
MAALRRLAITLVGSSAQVLVGDRVTLVGIDWVEQRGAGPLSASG